jgi:glycogen debranching enzyme
MEPTLIQIKTRPDAIVTSQSRTVCWCDRDGWIAPEDGRGLYIHETRMLSRYCWKPFRGRLYTVEASQVRQNSQLVYYISRPLRTYAAYSGSKAGPKSARRSTEETVELTLGTVLSDGFHQDADITNFSLEMQRVGFEIEYDADFADLDEAIQQERIQKGRRTVQVESNSGTVQIVWRYRASHRGHHLDRSFELSFNGLPPKVSANGRRLRFEANLAAGERLHLCIEGRAVVEGTLLAPMTACYQYFVGDTERDHLQREYIEHSACLRTTHRRQALFDTALRRSVYDLSSLRLYDLDRSDGWIPAAGVPLYVATFGRDTITAAWQSAMISPRIMRGALAVLPELQGQARDDWRDERPGKMIHEAHTGPLSVLNYKPQGRYYGSVTTSPFYVILLSEFYHWTGDRDTTLAYLPVALKAMEWIERYGDIDGDGFYEYQTRSKQGIRNQAWKDSGDAIVDRDGRLAPTPLGVCEEQGYVYEAKFRLTELLWMAGERAAAARMFRGAAKLKSRFNEVFWMPEDRYFAMARDARRRMIRSIASNAGDALATGIVDRSLAPDLVERLFQPDMFSGWGIRTLSRDHVSFDPYSYHRGSVWPAENAAIALGLKRYGFEDRLQQLAGGLLDVAAIFDLERLPEVFTGHHRDERHPFPAVYPESCSPQAWSAGAIIALLQMLLGIYPYAPAHTLFVDPYLPDWMPNVELRHLTVGNATVDLRFERDASGNCNYTVLALDGKLRLIRQPSPWSVTSGPFERVKDLIESLAA